MGNSQAGFAGAGQDILARANSGDCGLLSSAAEQSSGIGAVTAGCTAATGALSGTLRGDFRHLDLQRHSRAVADARSGQPGTPTNSRPNTTRSEEHTSELQSLRHLVCRLLLEKKKK